MAKRFRVLHDTVKQDRRPHFYQGEEKFPVLEEPLSHVRFQSDIARQKHEQLKARLNENHGKVVVNELEESKSSDVTDRCAAVLNAGWMKAEERLGYTLQDAMSDGQIVDAYAVLHWRRMDSIIPTVPEYEYLDELPEDDELDTPKDRQRKKRERERFEEDGDRYKETDKSLQERTRRARARAGWPYLFDVLDMTSVYWSHDTLTNVGMAAHVRTVSFMDYKDELKEADGLALSGIDDVLRVYPGDAPDLDDPSGTDYSQTVTIATLWTRSEWYELACIGDKARFEDTEQDNHEWSLIKSGKHNFGRPPFEIVPATTFNVADPVFRFWPALEGVYRTKEQFDRFMALFMGLAERTAAQDEWWEQHGQQFGPILEDGQSVVDMADSEGAAMAPAGWSRKFSQYQMPASFPQALELLGKFLEESAPDTGQAEIESGTQPWTARLAMQVANVKPKDLLTKQALALRGMMRSIARDISMPIEDGGLGEVWVFKFDEEGKESSELVGITADEIKTLNIDVDIDATSAPERITLVEHGRALLADPAVPLTTRRFIEEYLGWPNAGQVLRDWDAEQLWTQQIKPGRMAQAVAEFFGSKYVVGPDGQLAAMGGAPVRPEDVIAQNGWKPQQQPTPGPQGMMGPTMPDLRDQPPNGVMPQPGMIPG